MPFQISPDYREVPERIAEWYERHPEGRIVCTIVEHTDERVTVQAKVFRSQDPGEAPSGVGHSYLAIPGTTPYTKGSELENAETSAAGRALVMAGIPSKSIASEGEIRSKMSARQEPSTSPPADGAAPEIRVDTPGAAPTSSGAPETPGEERAGAPDLSSGEEGEPRSSSAGDTDGSGEASLNPPATSDAVTSLWNQLDQFAGSRAKAINAINKVCKSKWTRGNQQFIPLDDLESTLRYLLKAEGVA